MIQTELRFIDNEIVPLLNNNMQIGPIGWIGNTITLTDNSVPTINGAMQMPIASGWTYSQDGYLVSQQGSSQSFYQEVDVIKSGQTYKITFTVNGLGTYDINSFVTPSIAGYVGKPVYTNGTYVQYITITGSTQLLFIGAAGWISGETMISFIHTGLTYAIDPVSGATRYEWTVPDNCTIVSGSGTTSIIVDYNGFICGNISVYGTCDCGVNGTSSTKIIHLKDIDDGLACDTGITNVIEAGYPNSIYRSCNIDAGKIIYGTGGYPCDPGCSLFNGGTPCIVNLPILSGGTAC